MTRREGWEFGRVLRWNEPGLELGEPGPWTLDIFDADLGIWLTLAQADVEEDAMAQGIPILRGPYVVDYTDIPHDGDSKTLWTPAVGDIVLGVFSDGDSAVNWTNGTGALEIGRPAAPASIISNLEADSIYLQSALQQYIAATTAPIVITNAGGGGAAATAGHVELYALVVRAVAP